MTPLAPLLRDALAAGERAILVTITAAEGSTPREAGATMLVTRDAAQGTIGGGQLEFHAIDVAREMIAGDECERRLDIPLGPHLGQCCGGRVALLLRLAGQGALNALAAREAREHAARPHALLFGAGHVGLALARALALLPLQVTLVDDREGAPLSFPARRAQRAEGRESRIAVQEDGFPSPHDPLDRSAGNDSGASALPSNIRFVRAEDPEPLIHSAPPGAACIVLTHSHSLDYRLVDAALRRADAAYVGMIGSATKRARFERWFVQRGGTRAMLARLTCPIGGKATADKRPEIIAALATAEIAEHLFASAGTEIANTGKAGTTAETSARNRLVRSIHAA